MIRNEEKDNYSFFPRDVAISEIGNICDLVHSKGFPPNIIVSS